MRFYTVVIDGKELPAVSVDGGERAILLRDLGCDCRDMAQFVRESTKEKLQSLEAAAKQLVASEEPAKQPAASEEPGKQPAASEEPAKSFALDSVKLCAPIVCPDQDVICLGINYSAHAEEAGKFSKEAFGGERPYTIYFSKRVSRMTATGEGIPSYPGLVDSLDYESELGVVLGTETKGVTPENAEANIFGYTIINDVSARNLQTRHKQWYMGKSLDGFTPMGPCIVTPDELGDATNLEISSIVNGELRQSSNTKYMIQTVAGAIAELSAGMTLKAGTIIATGTPAGVGMGFDPPRFLHPGDEVICRIQGIGELVNTVE